MARPYPVRATTLFAVCRHVVLLGVVAIGLADGGPAAALRVPLLVLAAVTVLSRRR